MADNGNGMVAMPGMPTDISFGLQSPDILAVSTYARTIHIIDVSTRTTTASLKLKDRSGSLLCRKLEFLLDGNNKLVASMSDNSICIYDVQTELKETSRIQYEHPVNCIAAYDENLIAVGEDGGSIVLLDTRSEKKCMELKEHSPWTVTHFLADSPSGTLLAVIEEGRLVAVKVRSRKVVESVEFDQMLQCVGTFREKTKVGVGDDSGSFHFFDWGRLQFPTDKYKPCKVPISSMISITEKAAIVGYEDGYIRAYNFFPHQPLGVVGKHGDLVSGMDISRDGSLIATMADDDVVRFWDLNYFESLTPTHRPKKKTSKLSVDAARRHLPSSNQQNRADFFSGLNETDPVE